MRILQIAPAWINTPPSNYGGTEWVIYNLCENLIKNGHQVTLFATGKSKTSAKLEYVYEESFTEQNIPWSAALPAAIHYNEAFKLAEKGKFDLVHVHLSSQTDLLLLMNLQKLKVPHLMTIHSHWPFDTYSQQDEEFMKLYAKGVYASHISKAMEAASPSFLKSLGVAYNGLEIQSLNFVEKPQNYLSWIGRMVPQKGLHETIQVALKAGEKLVFAGVYDESDPKQVQYVEEKIMPLVDGKQIVYMGPANLKMKNEIFGNSKAFLNALQWEEPFGLTLVEAMAMGTPVISLNRGAVPEVVKDGVSGFVVNTLEEMVAAIQKLDQIDRAQCRAHVEKNFSSEAMVKQYLGLYSKAIAQQKFAATSPIKISGEYFKLPNLQNFEL